MTIDREPLDDDMLDAVSGGATTNGGCDNYQWNSIGAYDGSCNTCFLKQMGICSGK